MVDLRSMKISHGAIALVSGAIGALGFAPLFWWPLMLAAFALFIGQLSLPATPRAVLLRGWLFGFGHFAVGLNWLAKSFSYQSAMPAWLGWIAVAALAAILACFAAFAAWLAVFLVRGRGAWRHGRAATLPLILAFAASWGSGEFLRSVMFSGFAWNPLAEASLPTGLAAASRLIGTYGVGMLIVLMAGGVVALAQRQWRTATAVLIAPVLVGALGFASRPAFVAAPRPAVTLVQPDVGQQDKWDPAEAARNFRKLAALSPPRGDGPRLLLWTEAAFPDYLEDGYPPYAYDLPPEIARKRITALMGPQDIILTGALKLSFDEAGEPVSARNSIFAMDKSGMLIGRYDKAHLVPWAEYVPYRDFLAPLGITKLTPGGIDFLPGPGPRSMDLGGFGKVGLLICYELIFSGHVVDPARRPDFIFSPSNDAWFGGWGPAQHHAQARLRAIEEGLPVLRVTPTGVTSIIDADGATLRHIDHGPGRIDDRVPAPRGPTLFARWGNVLPTGIMVALVILALVTRRPFA